MNTQVGTEHTGHIDHMVSMEYNSGSGVSSKGPQRWGGAAKGVYCPALRRQLRFNLISGKGWGQRGRTGRAPSPAGFVPPCISVDWHWAGVLLSFQRLAQNSSFRALAAGDVAPLISWLTGTGDYSSSVTSSWGRSSGQRRQQPSWKVWVLPHARLGKSA